MNNTWTPVNEINTETVSINQWSSAKIIRYRVNELLAIHTALLCVAPVLEEAAALITKCVRSGGRVITIGAGGSGVAGMAVMRELPQNHREIDPAKFTYAVAGGVGILEPFGCEEIEDSSESGEADMERLKVGKADVVIAISATGRTPYTRGAAKRARERGAHTIGLICQPSELEVEVNLPIRLEAGPEMFFGATCEKAATAQTVALEAIMDAVVVALNLVSGNQCRARLCHEKARLREEFFTAHPDLCRPEKKTTLPGVVVAVCGM